MPVFIAPPGFDPFEHGGNPFGESFDLSSASNLSKLHLRGTRPDQQDGTPERFFEAFCQFVNGTVTTIKQGSGLKKLELLYIMGKYNKAILEAPFWEVPAWKELSATVGSAKSKKLGKHVQVELALKLAWIPEGEQVVACLGGRDLVWRSAPDIKVLVLFNGAPPQVPGE